LIIYQLDRRPPRVPFPFPLQICPNPPNQRAVLTVPHLPFLQASCAQASTAFTSLSVRNGRPTFAFTHPFHPCFMLPSFQSSWAGCFCPPPAQRFAQAATLPGRQLFPPCPPVPPSHVVPRNRSCQNSFGLLFFSPPPSFLVPSVLSGSKIFCDAKSTILFFPFFLYVCPLFKTCHLSRVVEENTQAHSPSKERCPQLQNALVRLGDPGPYGNLILLTLLWVLGRAFYVFSFFSLFLSWSFLARSPQFHQTFFAFFLLGHFRYPRWPCVPPQHRYGCWTLTHGCGTPFSTLWCVAGDSATSQPSPLFLIEPFFDSAETQFFSHPLGCWKAWGRVFFRFFEYEGEPSPPFEDHPTAPGLRSLQPFLASSPEVAQGFLKFRRFPVFFS